MILVLVTLVLVILVVYYMNMRNVALIDVYYIYI